MAFRLHHCLLFPANSNSQDRGFTKFSHKIQEKIMALLTTALAASTGTAAGFSLVYLLAGGGILGAGLIFLVAKML